MSGLESFKQDFDGWVEKWDAALKKGIFDAPSSPPSTCKSTSDDSFFGFRHDNHTDSIERSDSEYWRAIDAVASGGVEMQRLDEADTGVAPLAGPGPNPVRRGTEGKDQDMEPRQIGATFTKEELDDLDEMKKKLHDLHSKAAAMDDKDYSSQIQAMIKKIDDLSDKLGKVDR
jgi:hypothetical protein